MFALAATSWPDVFLFLIAAAFASFTFWLISRD